MKIAICDDEKEIREVLKNKIEKYYFPHSIEFSIREYASGEELLEEDLNEIEVLFLDVDMPGKNGMETAGEIRKVNQEMIIVFLTAYSEFVFESFKVDAFRYLVKPLKDSDLEEVLQTVEDMLYKDEDDYLSFQFQNENYHIRYKDIIYIDGMRNKIWIHCKEKTYRWRGVFKNLEEILREKGFFQVHRSYIINMEKIQMCNSQTVLMEDDSEVPISRYKLDSFREEYVKHWSKVL